MQLDEQRCQRRLCLSKSNARANRFLVLHAGLCMSQYQIEDRFHDLQSMLFQDVQLPQVLGIFRTLAILIHQQKFSVVFEVDDGPRVHGPSLTSPFMKPRLRWNGLK